MQNDITLVKVPLILTPDKRDIRSISYRENVTIRELCQDYINEIQDKVSPDKIVITRNGISVTNLDEFVMPNDFIAVCAYHGGNAFRMIAMIGLLIISAVLAPIIAPGLVTVFGAMGLTLGVATYIAGGVITMAGGLLINALMPPPKAEVPSGDNSPTYSFGGVRNNARAGWPIANVYGYTATAPQIISAYRKIDTSSLTYPYDMWQYVLLAAAQGKTNSQLNYTNIYLGDEKVDSYVDYEFASTDGDTNITAAKAALTSFSEIHHDRPFDKPILYDQVYDEACVLLLNFNGANHSTTIIDSSGRADSPTWTCYKNAEISTTSPWKGTGSLSIPTDESYIDTTDLEQMRLVGDFEVELKVKLLDTQSHGICGQQATLASSKANICRWGLYYLSTGVLLFQAYSGRSNYSGNPEDDGQTYYTWSVTAKVEGITDWISNQWYYVRIIKKAEYISLYAQKQSDGTLALISNNMVPGEVPKAIKGYVDYFRIIDGTESLQLDNFSAINFINLTSGQKSMFHQQIGYADYIDTAVAYPEEVSVDEGTAITRIYSRMYVDDFRVSKGNIHISNEDLPTAQLVPVQPIPNDNGSCIVSTESDCDYVDVLIDFPYGLFSTDSKDGDLTTNTITFELEYRATKIPPAVVENDWILQTPSEVIGEAKSRPIKQQYRITFPTRAKYDIRIRRINPEDDNQKSVSKSQLIGVDEVIDLGQYYPGMQIVGLGLKASEKISGSVPQVKIIHNRTLIDVAGWDSTILVPTTQSVDCTVPMWVAYDQMTNTFSGRGLSPLKFIQSAWEDWGDWCIGTLTAPSGETVRRCQWNGVFDEIGNLRDNVLNHIEQVGRARILPLGDKWTVIIDKPKSPVYCFSAGNIDSDSFMWETYEEEEKIDSVEIAFNDKDRGFKRNTVKHNATWYETLDVQPKVANIFLRGCNNKEQATREAIFRMQKTELITRHGNFTCGIEAAMCQYGDIIHIIHPSNINAFGGRLARDHSDADTIYLDQYINIDTTTYFGKLKLFLVDPDGNERSYDVTGPYDVDTNYVNIDTTVYGGYTGNRFDTFGLARPSEEKLLYQIINMSITQDQRVEIEFVEYNNNIYYHSDYGLSPI